ncbi:MAG: AraC family transcriptional regulator [Alphaproteobacteria bacterium]|jgi:AraC-like DNA-binding protein|nr:AraC family transcriptional regulator [Alphaproteobacteria bacterium]MBU1562229.1 AraC family transcriptional regulator [Alphaproteobacteria bacterium]MBU2302799.1 AraC family transcriptional regulator [Alphaproteobacteria bacterium]MBU2366456.1 AraC family transcriptional regulator [Alphaproteobacteria bacterium]
MDVLSDVLAAVRLTGAIFFDNTFREPWVAEAPKASAIAAAVMPTSQYVFFFHTLIEGSCWAELTEGASEPIRLEAGDIVAFPMDDAHAFCSSVGMRAKPSLAVYHHPVDRQLPYIVNDGSGAGTCRFICGYLGCDIHPYNPFIKSLPRVLHGHGTAAQSWLAHLVRHAVSETQSLRPGGETVLAKLAELLFVEVLRDYVDALPPEAHGWLAGLRDPQVGHALRLIHGQPAENWTLESLARAVGLSRSVFADRFAHFTGASPMQYVARWRMQLAARRLENPSVSIAQAGAEVGYESEAGFNRAFKKVVGLPPGAWRKGRLVSSADRAAALPS